MNVASSPTPDIEVFFVSGGADDLAAANIFPVCIETASTTLGAPLVVHLHPVFAIGDPAATSPNNRAHWILREPSAGRGFTVRDVSTVSRRHEHDGNAARRGWTA